MKKTTKGGLILAMLMAGNAQAALVKVDLSGTVSYGYKGSYDNNYNTGIYNSSYDDLTGTQARFSFFFDTSKAPDDSYNYSDSGYYDWLGNYSYSYSTNTFVNAVSSASGNVDGATVSGGNAFAYTHNSNWNYDYYGSGTWGGAELYSWNNSYSDNSSSSQSFGLYNFGNSTVNVQDFLSAFLSGANPISFYLNVYNYTWNNDGSANAGNYLYAYGNIDSFSVSPATVPLPAAVWLFGSALMGLFGIRKRKGMTPMLTA